MSLANKMASAAKSAVDNARKTADEALHDREALRKRIGTQVRDLPMTAVQVTVRGVGQALLVGDRVRQELGRRVGRGGHDAEPEAPDPIDATTPTPAKSAFEEAAKPEGVRPARKPRAAKGGATPVPPKDLPIADYDERTVPSLRARLKNLSVEDVRRLLEYEKTNAGRAEVIGMFERRITKLQAE